jgi:hypothetical protein
MAKVDIVASPVDRRGESGKIGSGKQKKRLAIGAWHLAKSQALIATGK